PPGPAPVTPPATPAPAVPAPNAPAPAAKAPIAAPGTPPLPRAAPGETIAIYRLEVPLYTAALPAAALLATSSLGSFHERQGDQRLLLGERALPASWGRWLGQSQRQAWAGAASPTFDGRLDGFQVGQDLFAHAGEGGLRQYAGFFVSHARLRGDVAGFALAFDDTDSGDLRLDGDSLGAYWTLLGAPGWYLDAVLMGSSFDGRARSARGLELPLQGHGYSLSLEAGYPLALDWRWAIEPQAQLIRQHLALDDSRDAVSTVDFEAGERWMARVGLRLRGDQEMAGMPLQSYLGVHFLQAFGEADGVVFADRQRLRTEQRGARVQVLAGLVLSPTPELGLYLTFGHADNLDSLDSRASQVSLGARLGW
ncbi:autotransporter domain-containing protein, partial [Pseudomonas citronellolis]|uniref:autotransporter domain-containing protein n=1 Tax=Pseudomonas citronellolis TaxID=53408 RepID=UPI0023E3DE10